MTKKWFVILLTGLSTVSIAQRVKLIEGDLKPLKGQTSVKTEFTYDNMRVGKDQMEQEYIAERKGKMNDKEAGRGDKWEQAWVSDRTDRFEPQFRELFAKHSSMSTVNDNSKYTIVFKTVRTEPGWYVSPVMRKPAFIDAEAWIFENNSPEKIIAKISILNCPGNAAFFNDFETGARLTEAYAKAGKELGGFIKSKSK